MTCIQYYDYELWNYEILWMLGNIINYEISWYEIFSLIKTAFRLVCNWKKVDWFHFSHNAYIVTYNIHYQSNSKDYYRWWMEKRQQVYNLWICGMYSVSILSWAVRSLFIRLRSFVDIFFHLQVQISPWFLRYTAWHSLRCFLCTA